MGKGSGRRPGEGYESNWDKIFGKKPEVQPALPEKNYCPRCGKRRGGDVNYFHTCTPRTFDDYGNKIV